MFKNLKIGTKLFVTFVLIGISFIFTSWVAVSNGNNIVGRVDMLYKGSFQQIAQIDSLLLSIQKGDQDLLRVIGAEDPAAAQEILSMAESDFQKLEEQINSLKADAANMDSRVNSIKKSDKTETKYVETLSSQQDAVVSSLAEAETLLKQAKDIRVEMISLLRQGENTQAYILHENEYLPLLNQVQSLLWQASSSVWAQGETIVNRIVSYNRGTLYWIAIQTLITLGVVVFLCTILIRSLVHPIKEIEAAAQELSDGKLDAAVHFESKDELGHLADSIRSTFQVLRALLRDMDYCLGQLAEGNFAVKSEDTSIYRGELSNMLESMKMIKTRLNTAFSQINAAASQVASGAEQVSSSAQALSQGATQQASSIEELAATITEISTQVQANAENAELAKQEASNAGANMEQSNQKMQDMVQAMEIINSTSNEIGKILKTIEDIAFQTNILALNAAVEAARAGAAGKGFAVVADEVRNLASKSAEAAQNTAVLIERSISAVTNGSTIVEDTAQSLIHAVSGVERVVKLVEHIAEASQQQSSAIGQISLGVEQVSAVVQTNSATAEESAASSEELSSQAQVVQNLVAQFKLDGRTADTGFSYQPEPAAADFGY